ncbi:MAG: DNA polymerase III subunit delta', partial [Paludibacteraceae bacterium]|nr:DNA polymerase III subunit delta' [Paludibacteraceae bacterium]
DSGRIPHAQLYTGAEGVGKLALAIAVAQYICCEHREGGESCGRCPSCVQFAKLSHPDLHFVFPIAKSDRVKVCNDAIEEFRSAVLENPYLTLEEWMDIISDKKAVHIYTTEGDEMIKKLSFKAYQGRYKVMIVWIAEKMNVECANKILKILEEPSEDTVFMLVSDRPEEVLGTIYSRCQRIAVPPIDAKDMQQALSARYDVGAEEVEYLVKNAMGSWGKMLGLMKESEESKMDFELFVQMMRLAWNLDVKGIRQWTEQVSKLTRDGQVRFLQKAQKMIRENFILRLNNRQLTYMNKAEMEFASKFARFIHEKNVVLIMEELALAEAQIAQNGNAKIILFHLEILLYKLLKRVRQ